MTRSRAGIGIGIGIRIGIGISIGNDSELELDICSRCILFPIVQKGFAQECRGEIEDGFQR